MRVQPYAVGSYLHIVKRGARGMPITNDSGDQWRFLRLLCHMNDHFIEPNWERQLDRTHPLTRPDSWPKKRPLVMILAYTLMPNHLHLLLKEVIENGVSTFMQKIGQSMTNHHNEKSGESGSIFQGSFRSRTIENDVYLRYVAVYIMVKNTFECYPHGGLSGATENFDDAWRWACNYRFSSMGEYAEGRTSLITHKEILNGMFRTQKQFKQFSYDVILGGTWTQTEFE